MENAAALAEMYQRYAMLERKYEAARITGSLAEKFSVWFRRQRMQKALQRLTGKLAGNPVVNIFRLW